MATTRPAPREPGAWQLWYLALGLERRRWPVLVVAALLMGGGSQALELLPVAEGAGNVVEIVVSTYLYFLFLAFVEVIAEHDQRGEVLTARRCLALAGGILGTAFAVALAGTVVLTGAGLLALFFVVPGVWFLTRSGLTVPAMVVERGGAAASVRRSFGLTAGRFWLALLTIGLALIVDEAVDAEVAILTTSPLRDGDWSTWIVGGIVSTAAVLITAPVVSMTYQRLSALGPARARRARRRADVDPHGTPH